jgi:sugar phosphate isomerase/epimerase
MASYGINSFELSGGMHFNDISNNLIKLSKKYSIVLHNYFPVPLEPFVFNLASLRQDIAEKSMLHAKLAIDLSYAVGSKYYSFHAGYLLDPGSQELGNLIRLRKLNNRIDSKNIFIERVNELSKYAATKNIKLMIENNVLSSENYHNFKNNAFLMVDPEETKEILEKVDKNVGLLIDVAHLKVSANSLKFSATEYLVEFRNKTWGYHISDNNGLSDTNHPVDKNSWFWTNLNKNLDYYSLEIYNVEADCLNKQMNLVNSKLR